MRKSMGLFMYFLFCSICLTIPMCYSTEIKIGVLLPEDNTYPYSRKWITPALDIAVENVLPSIIPGIKVLQIVKDSNCSGNIAPIAALDLYTIEHVHAFFGPFCDFALAPVARFSPHWNIPVLSAGANARDFENKNEYKLLTRVHAIYASNADAFIAIADHFNWTHFAFIFDRDSGEGKNDCHMWTSNVYYLIKDKFQREAWYHKITVTDQSRYGDILLSASQNSRIIVLCASPDVIREIMIEARELNFDNGEYVFLTFEHISSSAKIKQPWYRVTDTDEGNWKAMKAYEALMIVKVRHPTSPDYKQFVSEVRRRTNNPALEVSSVVGAFHDAMVLYGLAVKDALKANVSLRNGTFITQQMWNRTFQGITGTVHIDENGDRVTDYSLLDMNILTGDFEVVANYFGQSKRFEYIPDKFIQWPGNYHHAPPDTPKCGFDNSKCPPQGGHEDISTEKSLERKSEELLQTLQQTLTKMSETINEHNASLVAMTKLLQEKRRVDLESSMNCRPVLPDKTLKSIDCTDILNNGYTSSGLYKIYPTGSKSGYKVLCDLETDGGGWTIFQLRENLTYDFYRTWVEYEYGFGEVYPTLNFWLGLFQIHQITSQGAYELRIELENVTNDRAVALYQDFNVGNSTSGYAISVGSFRYDPYFNFPGDALTGVNNMKFSAHGMDNDVDDAVNCADYCHGAWWYNVCEHGDPGSDLNGRIGSEECRQFWASYSHDRISKTRMMLRRKQ
ncbi:atrial natriuretic peptide receptor 3-like [Mercenaria mercenaria]|uniref:atrial natriuretic peptide receptor 3-like n=1 Tax=Mercenaria mercenaria TaxID=6596 RepID=UPI00234E6A45|nr:atrial natriuretic peptide receptor 3-like [Mercenaria mercenaria]